MKKQEIHYPESTDSMVIITDLKCQLNKQFKINPFSIRKPSNFKSYKQKKNYD